MTVIGDRASLEPSRSRDVAAPQDIEEGFSILERDVSKLESVEGPFPRVSYVEAARILREKGLPFQEGTDLGAPDETALSEHFQQPVLVHRYPADVKAFYMKRDPEDERYALCVDVLAPEGVGEIIGGGQREDDLEVLEKRIDEEGLHIEVEGQERCLAVDQVVVCAGREPARQLYDTLIARGLEPHLIGGADEASELDAKRAIRQGTELGLRL